MGFTPSPNVSGSAITPDSITVDTNTLNVNVSGYTDKVGIGTATPSAKLEVQDTTNSPLAKFRGSGNERLTIYQPANGDWQLYPYDDDDDTYKALKLGHEKMIVEAGGDVGIGTMSPDKKLEILDATDAQLRLTHTDASLHTDFQTIAGGDLVVQHQNDSVILRGDGAQSYLILQNTGTGFVDATTDGLKVGCQGMNAYVQMMRGGTTLSLGAASLALTIDASKNATFLANISTTGNATLGDADADSHTVNGQITCGNRIIKSATVTCDANSTANSSVVVEVPNLTIPAESFITRVTAITKTLANVSMNTYALKLMTGTATGQGAGAVITNGVEILGPGATDTRDSNNTGTATLIDLSDMGTAKRVWINDFGSAVGLMIGGSDRYLYVANSGTGNNTATAVDGELTITIEYYGLD